MISAVETSSIWNGGEITRDMYSEMQQSMIKSAEQIAEKARQLVPVGDLGAHGPKASQTLHLKDTIRARGRRKKSGIEKFAHGLATGDYALETALPGAWIFAGDRKERVYWAAMVEFGTYESDAHPFLRPAVDANFNATLAHAERAGRRVLLKRRRQRAARRRAARG